MPFLLQISQYFKLFLDAFFLAHQVSYVLIPPQVYWLLPPLFCFFLSHMLTALFTSLFSPFFFPAVVSSCCSSIQVCAISSCFCPPISRCSLLLAFFSHPQWHLSRIPRQSGHFTALQSPCKVSLLFTFVALKLRAILKNVLWIHT